MTPRISYCFFAGVACLVIAMVWATVWQSAKRSKSHTRADAVAQLSQFRTADEPTSDLQKRDEVVRVATSHPVIINRPSGPPRVELAGVDPQGRSASVACSTCHNTRKPNFENKTAATLDEFHQGMVFDHGTIACYACHNPQDADTLRLADESSVSYPDVMTLCSQCHGQQATSFAHGAHGGMNGHWDLKAGPQMKNNCIDCHDPHSPAYPKMVVGFKPIDRFNHPEPTDDGHTEQP